MITMRSLCTELGLSPTYQNETQLSKLMTWCQENISQDYPISGSPTERYARYYQLATKYLDEFIPNVPDDFMAAVAKFSGMSTFAYAVQEGYHRFLESHPIPKHCINQPNPQKMTLLHIGAVNGRYHTVVTLLKQGADAAALNAQRQSPLFQAVWLPILFDDHILQTKTQIFQALLTANPGGLVAKDFEGNTLLHSLASRDVFIKLAQEVIGKAPQLVATQNNQSRYPIHVAILNNQLLMCQLLLGQKEVCKLADGKQHNALDYAACYGNADIVNCCIQLGGMLEKRDGESRTPLLLAAQYGNQPAVGALIAANADLNVVDYRGFTILHYAVEGNYHALTEVLLAKVPAKMVNQEDKEGHTPLYYANAHRNEQLISLLIGKGATPIAQSASP